MTRDQLLESISQAEFIDWLALQSVSPIFDPWIANAISCKVTAAAAGTTVPLQKFLPYKLARRKQTSVELKAALRRRVKVDHGTD